MVLNEKILYLCAKWTEWQLLNDYSIIYFTTDTVLIY